MGHCGCGPACPGWAGPHVESAARCTRCRPEPLPIDRIVAPWRFGGPLASAIRKLKFANATHVARALAPLWSPLIAAAADGALVVPVPTHWRRRFPGGYHPPRVVPQHAGAPPRVAPARP